MTAADPDAGGSVGAAARARRCAIWAQDLNGVLGDGRSLLWRVPADSAHFKERTMGCPVIMGRATFQSLPKPLPGRSNIVVSRSTDFHHDGATVVSDLKQAFEVAEEAALDMGADTIWVAGGAEIYAQTVDLVDELVVTELDLEVRAQTGLVVAPCLEPSMWTKTTGPWQPKSGDARWRVVTYSRTGAT